MLFNGKFLKVLPDNKDDFFNLSVSKAKTFKQCKAKYHFCYIKKLPRKEWDFLIFGKFLHEVLELFEKQIIAKDNRPLHILMKACFTKALVNWESKMTPEQKKECFDILSSFLKKRKDAKYTPLFAEKDFSIDIGNNILLNGFIDLVKIDNDGVLHVADYKTSKSKQYLKKDYMQLKTYAYVMCLEDPDLQKVRCSYIMLRHDFDEIMFEFSREDLLDTEQEFKDYASSIWAEKLFRPEPSPLCKFCDYIGSCDAGSKKMGVKSDFFGETDW